MRDQSRIEAIFAAVAAIKEHIDKDPFKYKSSIRILNDLNSTLDRRKLEKAFSDVYGYGIKKYQVKARLNEAKKMIIKGIPKKTIANKCYYATPSAFTTAFKRQFNMTPIQWEHTLKIKEIEDSLNNE